MLATQDLPTWAIANFVVLDVLVGLLVLGAWAPWRR